MERFFNDYKMNVLFSSMKLYSNAILTEHHQRNKN